MKEVNVEQESYALMNLHTLLCLSYLTKEADVERKSSALMRLHTILHLLYLTKEADVEQKSYALMRLHALLYILYLIKEAHVEWTSHGINLFYKFPHVRRDSGWKLSTECGKSMQNALRSISMTRIGG